MKIYIPENLLNKIIEDRGNYALSFEKMASYLNSQGVDITADGLKKRLRREGLIH